MKKIVFLFFLFCFILVGCGKTPEVTPTPTPTPVPTETKDETEETKETEHTHDFTGAWVCDASNHWKECSCGEIKDKNAHSGGTATETERAICNTCNTPYGTCLDSDNYPDHVHGVDFEWKYDETYHWKKCSCGAPGEYELHKGGTATETLKAICEVCGAPYGELKEPTVNVPTEPEVDPNAPTLKAGYCDTGYSIIKDSSTGKYTINKASTATLWTVASLDIEGYSSNYSSFTIKYSSKDVTVFTIQIYFEGGDANWSSYATIYQANIEDGEHEITIDFSDEHPQDGSTWQDVLSAYVKDYDVKSIKFSLDTTGDLVSKDSYIIIDELTFNKVGNVEDDPVIPTEPSIPTEPNEPTQPEVDPNAPTLKAGYCDGGYSISKDSETGEFTINKASTATLWTVATLDIEGYASNYSSFTIKYNSKDVKDFTIQVYFEGGDANWSKFVTVYQGTLQDGEHEITVDFSDAHPQDKSSWQYVLDEYVKDYDVKALKFSLDTTNELVAKDASITIEKLVFNKVGNIEEDPIIPTEPSIPTEPENPEQPTQPELPEEPEVVDPNAPTLSAGYCDSGYSISMDQTTGKFTVNKASTVGLWTVATIHVNNYTSEYSSFYIKFTTKNVSVFSIQVYYTGGESNWTQYVSVYKVTLEDGQHDILIDFTDIQAQDKNTWQTVPGYFVKDYQVVGLKISLDTTDKLVEKDASCVIDKLTFKKVVFEEAPYDENEVYTRTDTTVTFSDENESKVITEPTFDITQYTNNAAHSIHPYLLFQSGMCLQRDAIIRIWGTAVNTNYIAAQFKGKVYYGTVNNNGEWEIYLPKMNAGGPYNLTFITEAGRLMLTNVYVGEVFYCGGQSNMEWQPQHSGDVLKDLYATDACINDNIRLLHIKYNAQAEPTTSGLNSAQWKRADKSTIPYFSAVAYLFAKQMQEELGCPVGVIAAPVGGSNIEFWLEESNYNKVTEIYTPYITSDEFFQPTLGYNGMLYPLTGYTLRGVVWYQGCSNAFGTQNYYDKALTIFMEQCREMFNNEELTFTVCELARYEMNPLAYSTINEKINAVAKDNPYMVVARNLDLGEWNDIHPKDKREIASRAAYETLRVFFKKDKPAPVTVSDYTFNSDGSVTIQLSSAAELLNGTNGFEVFVNGSYTYNCNVTIEDDTLTVTANGEITKVRYGYQCNMTNEIKEDVSKMVTVYDENGFPLDIFLISK